MKNEKRTEPGSAFLPQVSETRFIMKTFQWEHVESKPEVTERRARASGPLFLFPPPQTYSLSTSAPRLGNLHSASPASDLGGV